MTLASKMIVVEPTPYRPVFDEARRLIGAEHGQYKEGPYGIESKWGQSFVSWVGVGYGADAPLTNDHEGGCDEEYCRCYPVSEWSIEVHLDTTYGYKADNGAGCSDLHAWIMRELGKWLTERNLTWYWYLEFDGTWHPSTDPLTLLGDPDDGALPIKTEAR